MGQPIENAATDAARKKAEELREQVLAEEKNGEGRHGRRGRCRARPCQ